jgi:methionine-gamma-lyase
MPTKSKRGSCGPGEWPAFDGALSLPIVRSTTFVAPTAEVHRERFISHDPRFYQRFFHPTLEAAAQAVSRLEGGEAGLVFSSGMGAISTTLMTLLKGGDHAVAHHEIFAQTKTFLSSVLGAYGVSTTFVDARRPGEIAAAIRPETRLLVIETPTNPLLQVIDIAAAARIVAGRPIETIVDGTFASPALQRPLEHGATIVVHSGTKYLGGHSDVMCGAVVARRELIERIRRMQILLGSILDPEAAWLLHRGTKTLDLRVRRQSATALAVATSLRDHGAVAEVRYPFLPGAPDHEIASRQMSAGGGVVSFEVKGGAAAARRFVDALRVIPIATSLGGVETVIELPYDLDFSTGETGGDAQRGNVPGLVRLSVGLEERAELIADLRQALDRVAG